MLRKDFVWGAADQGALFHDKEKLALMRLLGITHYRLNLDWERLLPGGIGNVSEDGIREYRELLIAMRENGIEPYLTLYHQGLPKALRNRGGWRNPDSPGWFEEYAAVAAERFSDLVRCFITVNDPSKGLLSEDGGSEEDRYLSAHHLLMAHGRGARAIREHIRGEARIGFAVSGEAACPATRSEDDIEAARRSHFSMDKEKGPGSGNGTWFLDPILFGTYPEDGLRSFRASLPEIREEDMRLIHQPPDFIGLNLYQGYRVKNEDGRSSILSRLPGYAHTDCDWPVTPAALYWGSRFLSEKYHIPLVITECGMASCDLVSTDGGVHDPQRIAYLEGYLGAMQKAADGGADIRGCFLRSFFDELPEEECCGRRFGLVYTDERAGLRIVKDSGYWYQKVMETNGGSLSVNQKPRQALFLEKDDEGEVGITSWILEGAYAGLTLDELLHQAPELFGGVYQPPARTEMITLEIEDEASFLQDQSYLYITVTEGDGLLNGHYIQKGDHFILPEGFGTASFRGRLTILVSARVSGSASAADSGSAV